MITIETQKKYYQALLDKNTEYEGVFYVGVKTTGVFCRPTCPARKPKFEHCEFYKTVQEALLASFRPCKRCRPLSHPNQVSSLIQTLVDAVETNPQKRAIVKCCVREKIFTRRRPSHSLSCAAHFVVGHRQNLYLEEHPLNA